MYDRVWLEDRKAEKILTRKISTRVVSVQNLAKMEYYRPSPRLMFRFQLLADVRFSTYFQQGFSTYFQIRKFKPRRFSVCCGRQGLFHSNPSTGATVIVIAELYLWSVSPHWRLGDNCKINGSLSPREVTRLTDAIHSWSGYILSVGLTHVSPINTTFL